jgi:hypothetical protein
MNLTDLFTTLNLQSTWTGIILREDKQGFMDITDFAPLTRTKFGTINATGLDPTTFLVTQGVLLKNVDTTGGFNFAYVPTLADTTHRAVCLKAIPFPKKKSSLTTLKMIKTTFFKQADDVKRSVKATSLLANHSLAILPRLPPGTDISGVRKAEPYDPNINDDLDELESRVEQIGTLFTNIETEMDVTQLMLRHMSLLEIVKRTERRLIDPLYHPLSLVDEKWEADLRPDSVMNIYTKDDSDNTIVLQVEKALSITENSPVTNRFRTRQYLPEPFSSTTSLPDGTEPTPDLDISTPLSTSNTPIMSTSTSTTTTTTTITTTTTTTFTTTTRATTTSKALVPVAPEQSWGDWFFDKWQKMKTFSEFLEMSFKMPSIYDIIFMIILGIHKVLILYLYFGKKRKPIIVRKMDYKPPRMFRRHSDGSVKSVIAEPSAPIMPMEMLRLRKPNPTRRVQIVEDSHSSSDDEETPMRVRTAKRLAPPPPLAMYNMPSTSTDTQNYYKPSTKERKGRLYLPKSVPLYLVESEPNLDKYN